MPKFLLNPEEETSILFEGDFDNNQHSREIKSAFNKSLAIDTKIPSWIKFMSGMTGKKYRYFINNLLSSINNPRYLEIGSWSGSSVCAAMYGNKLKVICIDDWSQFQNTDDIPYQKALNVQNPKEKFELNTSKVLSEHIDFKFVESDFRKVDYSKIGKFNTYFFDGPHEEVDQYDGIIVAQPSLDDTFILIVDDWNYPQVRKGTHGALTKLSLNIVSKIEIRTTQHDKDPNLLKFHFSDWHNGYFIAVCQKNKI